MQRRSDLEERSGNEVYVGCHAARVVDCDEKVIHAIIGKDPQLRRLVFDYLNAGAGVLDLANPDIKYGHLETERRVKVAWDDYCKAEREETGWLMRWVVAHLLPTTEITGFSRMGSVMRTLVHDPDTLLTTVAIARGGDEPTFFGRDNILGPSIRTSIPLIRAQCQRVHKEKLIFPPGVNGLKDVYLPDLDYFEEPPVWLPRPELQYGIKGVCSLSGRILVGVEAADASGVTPHGLFPYLFDKCESVPEELILVFLNAHPAGIKYLQETIHVPTKIVVGMMHLGLDVSWYLRGPGMFDGGKMRHLTNG